eukprot:6192003-Pleurochrysis_carterae.AAC.1
MQELERKWQPGQLRGWSQRQLKGQEGDVGGSVGSGSDRSGVMGSGGSVQRRQECAAATAAPVTVAAPPTKVIVVIGRFARNEVTEDMRCCSNRNQSALITETCDLLLLTCLAFRGNLADAAWIRDKVISERQVPAMELVEAPLRGLSSLSSKSVAYTFWCEYALLVPADLLTAHKPGTLSEI